MEQAEMVAYYLRLWITYRETLMHGKMLYKGYANDYLYVSARDMLIQVGVVMAGRTAYVETPTEKMIFINASLDTTMLFEIKETKTYDCTICDCKGKQLRCIQVKTKGLYSLEDIPINGTVILTEI